MGVVAKRILLFVFIVLIIITSVLVIIFLNSTKNNESQALINIPTVSIKAPVVGEISLYVNPDDLQEAKVDSPSLINVSTSYKEGALDNNSQIYYSKFVRYSKDQLTINPNGQKYNLNFLVEQNTDIVCWPRYFTTSDGKQIDLKDIWVDTKGKNELHLDGEVTRKWIDVYNNTKEGDSVIVVLDGEYDLNSDNKPKEIVVIGCV